MNKLFGYFLISVIANFSFLAGISVIFNNSIWIEFHVEQNLVFVALIIFLISIILISKMLSKLLGEKTSKYILRILTTILITSFSINIFTLIKAITNVFKYQDEIFVCKFFTMHYKYSRRELEYFIDQYYSEISKIAKRLTIKERTNILGDAKTIREVREKVEAYCDYEATAWWPKLWNAFENSISYSFEHPWILVGAITGITLIIAYPIWGYIKNVSDIQKNIQKNVSDIQKVEVSVSELNELVRVSVSDLNTYSQNIVEGIRNIKSSLALQDETQKILIKLLSDYFSFSIDIIDNEELYANRKAYLAHFIASLSDLEDPDLIFPPRLEQD